MWGRSKPLTFHWILPWVRGGSDPPKGMVRLQNLMLGARRGKGPAKRKMPVTAEDLNKIYEAVDWGNPDSVILRCTISIDWFSTLRMGGYLDKHTKLEDEGDVNSRRPILMEEIEPMVNGTMADWSGRWMGFPFIYIADQDRLGKPRYGKFSQHYPGAWKQLPLSPCPRTNKVAALAPGEVPSGKGPCVRILDVRKTDQSRPIGIVITHVPVSTGGEPILLFDPLVASGGRHRPI